MVILSPILPNNDPAHTNKRDLAIVSNPAKFTTVTKLLRELIDFGMAVSGVGLTA
jgi:hypothetical protein